MHIRKSGSKYVLHRYGGSQDGKNLSARIGAIEVGTSASAIPNELLQDLTPKELQHLKAELEKDAIALLAATTEKLIGEMVDVACSIDAGFMTPETVVKVQCAADKLSRAARRALAKASATKSKEVER